jgi:chemotaxis protein MotB
MTNSFVKHLTAFMAITLILSACVPNRKFMDMSAKHQACERENEELRRNNEELSTRIKEFDTNYAVAERKIDALKSDTAVLGNSLRILRKQYDKINALNDQLLSKTASLREGTEEEKQTLMAELENTRLALLEKEDALNQLEETLNVKERELMEREQKLDQLRAAINEKDSVMNALRTTVADALLGFVDKGLTVEKRNGRVYVSMEAKLLFETGKTAVDAQGRNAIIDLARALEGQEDLNIIVEGHTDTDEFNRTTYPRNNWDLSVLRATSVISIMLENSDVDPESLMAAGRSQYHPVDPQDKSKNRRIEVILSPKLDELMDLIQD